MPRIICLNPLEQPGSKATPRESTKMSGARLRRRCNLLNFKVLFEIPFTDYAYQASRVVSKSLHMSWVLSARFGSRGTVLSVVSFSLHTDGLAPPDEILAAL